ncbi:hypothetical protein [Rubritalea profundi]|uniref:O-antigen polymerase n=1 Tax=Rubritalea profundi TaxID=1658618 RepID=A0A2S7U1N9_9BACT|nr:hypothetical protein [Rubritalea profundi]PQJ28093.1 hypothetical protein BSZ32_05955 [Rubritalea profundi]
MNQGIKNIAVIIAALLIAVFLGQWVVTDPKLAGITIAIFGAIGLFFALGKNVWMLIFVGSSLSMSFPFIPGGFTSRELALLFVIGCSVLLLVTRKISIRLQMTSLEWVAMLLCLFILQAYMRNPVGINMFGSEYVGGRPYFNCVIALIGGVVLASTQTNLATIKRLYWWSLLSMGFSACIHVAAHVSGTIASYTGRVFGVYGKLADPITQVDNGRSGRNSGGSKVAHFCSRWLAASVSPLRALFHPLWAAVLLASLVGAGVSGFRNVIASTVLTLALATFYWGGMRAVIKATCISGVLYFLLNVVNLMTPLPASIQRSLSFLPGTWEELHIEDANASTDWRLEMWKEALLGDVYIENKWIGDGLGIRRDNLAYMEEMSYAAVLSDEMSQERAMIAGDYHSGPVSTIAVIGYIGLIFVIIALIMVANRAHRLILHSRGKAYFREVLFFCIPMVWLPVFFLFIFGDVKSVFGIIFINIGLIRMLERNRSSFEVEHTIEP